jgi:hypothetical protein
MPPPCTLAILPLVVMAALPIPGSGASLTCNATTASSNANAGRCPIAKCSAITAYPAACTRVDRQRMTTCPPAGAATVSSTDPECCCSKMCHLEWPNGTQCWPAAACEDFACCARNGNPIMESYPEQCADPLSGRTFTKCHPDGTGCPSAGSSPSNGLFDSGAGKLSALLFLLTLLLVVGL